MSQFARRTTNISITLSNDTLDKLDKARKLIPRSTLIDYLISKSLKKKNSFPSKENQTITNGDDSIIE
ncbi:hypothetical protein [Nitrosopumilus cobalaminigenes]|uniref:hypothetical protein n=1 Tax=Nitrosopumilus cobalaminigenes TaxID=1470066 RepID=UPI0015C75C56|nr:hypothetical protein [Nitrosopumilus cobalaminigenes]